MNAKQSLQDMGFNTEKIEKAISICGNNLEQAMEWLLAHSDDVDTSASVDPLPASNASEGEKTTESSIDGSEEKTENADNALIEDEAVAKSLKCDECDKLFQSTEQAEFHAVKSGHSSFSESTEEKRPLTEEEKQLKLKELSEKLKLRRKEKEEEERKEVIDKEKKRIQMSRDMAETKRRMEEQDMKKLADQRRREKLEDKMARQKIIEQIEKDKLARKEAISGASKTSTAVIQPSVSPAQSPSNNHSQPQKDYDSTRLQIRLPSGPPLVQEFKAKETLSAVRLWVQLNRKDKDPAPHSFSLSTTFPRKVFDENDMEKSLLLLELVPSAVLVVLDR